MENVQLSLDDDSIEIILTEEIKQQLITNAQYFKCTNILPALKLIVSEPYDIATWFTHSNGKRFGVVHTIPASNSPQDLFAGLIHNHKWSVSASHFEYKKQAIKDYFTENSCDQSVVYCLF